MAMRACRGQTTPRGFAEAVGQVPAEEWKNLAVELDRAASAHVRPLDQASFDFVCGQEEKPSLADLTARILTAGRFRDAVEFAGRLSWPQRSMLSSEMAVAIAVSKGLVEWAAGEGRGDSGELACFLGTIDDRPDWGATDRSGARMVSERLFLERGILFSRPQILSCFRARQAPPFDDVETETLAGVMLGEGLANRSRLDPVLEILTRKENLTVPAFGCQGGRDGDGTVIVQILTGNPVFHRGPGLARHLLGPEIRGIPLGKWASAPHQETPFGSIQPAAFERSECPYAPDFEGWTIAHWVAWSLPGAINREDRELMSLPDGSGWTVAHSLAMSDLRGAPAWTECLRAGRQGATPLHVAAWLTARVPAECLDVCDLKGGSVFRALVNGRMLNRRGAGIPEKPGRLVEEGARNRPIPLEPGEIARLSGKMQLFLAKILLDRILESGAGARPSWWNAGGDAMMVEGLLESFAAGNSPEPGFSRSVERFLDASAEVPECAGALKALESAMKRSKTGWGRDVFNEVRDRWRIRREMSPNPEGTAQDEREAWL